MKSLRTTVTLIILILIKHEFVIAQPFPAELMTGKKYGTVNFAFSRNFSETSRFGFFHMNTIEFGIKDEAYNDFIIQDLLYIETIKNFRITGGAVYSPGGFNTTAGLQYVFGGRRLFILLAPRVNIENNPSYDLMTIIQFKPQLSSKIKFYTRLQMLNLFNSEGNMKSYQWMRLGVEIREMQFGLAGNVDECGPNPTVETNFGLFFRKEFY